MFGVPLVLLLQRTGQTIPTAIQTALKWLKLNALDQVNDFYRNKNCMQKKTHKSNSNILWKLGWIVS